MKKNTVVVRLFIGKVFGTNLVFCKKTKRWDFFLLFLEFTSARSAMCERVKVKNNLTNPACSTVHVSSIVHKESSRFYLNHF